MDLEKAVRIVSDGPSTRSVKVFVGETEIDYIQEINIKMQPDSLIMADMKVMVGFLDIKAMARIENSMNGNIHHDDLGRVFYVGR